MKLQISTIKKINTLDFNSNLKSIYKDKINSIVHYGDFIEIYYENLLSNDTEYIIEYYNSITPISEIDISKIKLKNRINLIRNKTVSGFFPHKIDGVIYYFDADDRSGIRIDGLGVVSSLALITEELMFNQVFIDKDNKKHTLNAQQCFDLFSSAGINEQYIVFKAVHIKENIIDAAIYSNADEIDAINAQELWDDTQWP